MKFLFYMYFIYIIYKYFVTILKTFVFSFFSSETNVILFLFHLYLNNVENHSLEIKKKKKTFNMPTPNLPRSRLVLRFSHPEIGMRHP